MYLPSDSTIAFYLKYRSLIKYSLWAEGVPAFFFIINVSDHEYYDAVLVGVVFTAIIIAGAAYIAIRHQRDGSQLYQDPEPSAVALARFELGEFYKHERLPFLMTGIPAVGAAGIVVAAAGAAFGNGGWAHMGTWVGLALSSIVGLMLAFVVIVLLDLVVRSRFDAPAGLSKDDERFLSEIERLT